jgi:hypothetical protein
MVLVSTTRKEGNLVCLCLMKIHRPFTVRNLYLHWMRSSREVRASGYQCHSRNRPGFDPSILRLSGIWGAADEAVLDNVQKKKQSNKSPFYIFTDATSIVITFFSEQLTGI